jgi:hypothetical protein
MSDITSEEMLDNQDFDELLEVGELENQGRQKKRPYKRRKLGSEARPTCSSTTKDNTPCPASGSTFYEGKPYCYWHNPAVSDEEKKAARSRGGIARTVNRPKVSVNLRSPEDVVALMENVCGWVLSGNINARDDATIVAAVREARTSMQDNLEKRLKALEKSVKVK